MRKMNISHTGTRQTTQPRMANGERGQQFKCFLCHEEGHYKRNCPNVEKVQKFSLNLNQKPNQKQESSLN